MEILGVKKEHWSATVKPPRLGGKVRLGVFATRSPFRPNDIGLSCVRLLRVEQTEKGPKLYVAGADLMDGTPIYDMKPYIPVSDVTGSIRRVYQSDKGACVAGGISGRASEPLPGREAKRSDRCAVSGSKTGLCTGPERLYGVSFAGFV